jgi:hypothetical protein
VENNIGNEIIERAKEKRFDEIVKLTEVPAICKEYKDYVRMTLENPDIK